MNSEASAKPLNGKVALSPAVRRGIGAGRLQGGLHAKARNVAISYTGVH